MYPSTASSETFEASTRLLGRDEKTNALHLNNKALNLIRNLDGNIAVVTCMGEKSSGKSFLLNGLFKYFTNQPYNVNYIDFMNKITNKPKLTVFTTFQVFQLDHHDNSATKGCWMNTEIPMLKSNIKENRLNLLLIDTEVSLARRPLLEKNLKLIN